MEEKKIPLLCVVGPTASGKTELGVRLAQCFGGEVVSADSMQIYKGFRIATAKPTPEEQEGIPHHLIDFLEPDRAFSLAEYLVLAKKAVQEIHSRHKLPILVGGTGLYVTSLVDNVELEEIKGDPLLRARLEREYDLDGGAALMEHLALIDPESAGRIHRNNRGRVVRALEVYELTGMPISEHQRRSKAKDSPYRLCMIGLKADDRAYLYDRINRRVDKMLEKGLLEEAKQVRELGLSQTAAQAIGYKELFSYLDGQCSLDEAVERLKQSTRRYAKRQLTRFCRDERVRWFSIDTLPREELFEKAVKYVEECLRLC